ncbi:LLM class F420-dependent oxidoreductase [Streptomyces sp. NBC_00873]|uniref:LLM class F420-dependent oxidoreductase n=1 Tax=unclassified Streptomyces TaxID=2593676 RepID=UPI00386C74E1|nr:LLM class F420-dependent oxidoreductase [Streptomyces sp. NBC_00873]WTA41950.1 LLM class F420-dependent oxidoreductase [Streptomyces sp. NBC_00842]
MKLSLNLGYWGSERRDDLALVQLAEDVGFDCVWVGEAYGSDGVTPLAWLAARTKHIGLGTAVLQMAGRSPALTAMTAATMDALSDGRFRLGLGMSGPQVVEGWHGIPYGKPMRRTREYVDVVRQALRREKPVEHHGEYYDIPYRGADGTGLGKPLKLILHPRRPDLPIYLAALGPQNVKLAGEIADGWLPVFFSPTRFEEVFAPTLGPVGPDFDVSPIVEVVVGPDVRECRMRVKHTIALYMGGMGAKGRNFYQVMATRYGYGHATEKIQELFLSGRKDEAAAAVPDELVDEVALCGPPGRIGELLERWTSSPITSMSCMTRDPEAVRLLADLLR